MSSNHRYATMPWRGVLEEKEEEEARAVGNVQLRACITDIHTRHIC